MRLREISDAVDTISPFSLAADWDNVGLLAGDLDWVQPVDQSNSPCVLLCIDLTQDVVDEAIALHERAPLAAVIAYHPPLFREIQNLTSTSREGRTLLPLLHRRIGVISPHTALDSIVGGVNDWLLDAIVPEDLKAPGSVMSIEQATPKRTYKVITFVPTHHVDRVAAAFTEAGAGVIGEYTACSFRTEGIGTFLGSERSQPSVGTAGAYERIDETRLEMQCDATQLNDVIRAVDTAHPYEEPVLDIIRREPDPSIRSHVGMGRICDLNQSIQLAEAAERAADVFRIPMSVIRSAHGRGQQAYQRVAVCPGAGGSMFRSDRVRVPGTLLVTGEMQHHDVLAAVDAGCGVMLAGHTNTERGYLPVYAKMLTDAMPGVSVHISEADRWPFSL